MIVRDADILLTEEDYNNVESWISDRNEPIFRYFKPDRENTFLAGAVGFKHQMFKKIEDELTSFEKTTDKNIYGWDEDFLDSAFKNEDAYVREI